MSSCYPRLQFVRRDETSQCPPIVNREFHHLCRPEGGLSSHWALDPLLLVAAAIPVLHARVPSLVHRHSAMQCARRSAMPFPKLMVCLPRPPRLIPPRLCLLPPRLDFRRRSWLSLGANDPLTFCAVSGPCHQRSVSRCPGSPRRIRRDPSIINRRRGSLRH